MEESSQRAHATFENGADPSGTDRGLNQLLFSYLSTRTSTYLEVQLD